jgi:hypothetical protein
MQLVLLSAFLLLACPVSAKPNCVAYKAGSPYDACFGTCQAYAEDYKDGNFEYCEIDSDINGVMAEDACQY